MKSKLIEKVLFRVVVTVLVGILLAMVLWLLFPIWHADELEHTTVTLQNCRYETVGFVPKKHGSGDIDALIFTASDREQYQIAMFHKKEGEALKGKTVEIGYKENGSSYDGAHMIVELTVDGESVYDLTDWNAFQKNRRAVLFWVWFGVTVLVNLPLILDILEYGGIVKRRRRHRRYRKAHEEQIRNLENRPRNFPNTVWQTEDGTLTLTVAPDGSVTGTIRIPDGDTVKSIPVLFDDTAHTTVRIAKLSRRGSGKKHAGYVEIWEADYDSPVEFTAKPKKTTYFKKGRTLTVRRIDGEWS